MGSQSKLNLAG